MDESPKTITVDAFAEATIGAVMRASDARRARLASAADAPDPASGLAGLALAAAGYPIVVYGIIAGPGWPWGGVAGGALAGLGGAVDAPGASPSAPSGGTPVAGE